MNETLDPVDGLGLSDFFISCTGIDKEVLASCASQKDRNQFATLGAILCCTAFFATLSGSYALSKVFNEPIISISLGIAWGIFIFSIDRFVISSMSKNHHFIKQVMYSLPRFVIAIFIAIIVARPLELKLFEKEITQHLHNTKEEGIKELERQTAVLIENQKDQKEYDIKLREEKLNKDIEIAKSRLKIIKDELKKDKDIRNSAEKDYLCESDGSCGSKIYGCGGRCKEKKVTFENLKREYKQKFQEYQPRIEALNKQLNDLTKQKQNNRIYIDNKYRNEENKINSNKDTNIKSFEEHFSFSLMARDRALNELSRQNEAVKKTAFFITILFVLIEILPVLVKLLTPSSLYDHRMNDVLRKSKNDSDTHKTELQHDKNLQQAKLKLKQHIEDIKNKIFKKIKDEIEINIKNKKMKNDYFKNIINEDHINEIIDISHSNMGNDFEDLKKDNKHESQKESKYKNKRKEFSQNDPACGIRAIFSYNKEVFVRVMVIIIVTMVLILFIQSYNEALLNSFILTYVPILGITLTAASIK